VVSFFIGADFLVIDYFTSKAIWRQVKKSSGAGKKKTPFLVVLATKEEYKASKKFLKNVLLHLDRENLHVW